MTLTNSLVWARSWRFPLLKVTACLDFKSLRKKVPLLILPGISWQSDYSLIFDILCSYSHFGKENKILLYVMSYRSHSPSSTKCLPHCLFRNLEVCILDWLGTEMKPNVFAFLTGLIQKWSLMYLLFWQIRQKHEVKVVGILWSHFPYDEWA